MKRVLVFLKDQHAGFLSEIEKGKKYIFEYLQNYNGSGISLTMPVSQRIYEFNQFPAFFDGLLPEGHQLEFILKQNKVDRDNPFSLLLLVGGDLVGAVTVKEES